MNPAAILARLKPDFSGLAGKIRLPGLRIKLPFRKKKGGDGGDWADGDDDGAGWRDSAAEKPRRRIPWGKIGAALGVMSGLAAAGGGLWFWLDSNAAATRADWEAAIPAVTVEVTGVRPAPPPPPVAATPPPAAAAATATAAPPTETAAAPPPLLPPPGPVTLTPAPAPGLVEESRHGPLPRVSDDGRKPWKVYARPFPANDPRPRVAIIIADMGMSGVTTGNALQRLPAGVTLGFTAHAERLESWVERAREKGHEVMLTVPMEPADFPRSDPGPNALLTKSTPDRNIDRLEWALGRFLGYVGVVSPNGGKFTGHADAMRPVLEVVKARGLLYVDPGLMRHPPGLALAGEIGAPRAVADRFIDRDLSRGAIDEQLRELETVAKENGAAVGIGLPYPSTIERIEVWARTLNDRGVTLAPVSAVVDRQKSLPAVDPAAAAKAAAAPPRPAAATAPKPAPPAAAAHH